MMHMYVCINVCVKIKIHTSWKHVEKHEALAFFQKHPFTDSELGTLRESSQSHPTIEVFRTYSDSPWHLTYLFMTHSNCKAYYRS